MAIDPLSSQATSRVAEFQRGSGDEKRRQDSAAFFLSRPQGPGAQAFAANEAPKPQDGIGAIGGRAERGKAALAPGGSGQQASFENSVKTGFAQEAAGLARNDSRSLFASIGFAAQQLSQEGNDGGAAPAASGRGTRDAFNAYSSAQGRVSGSAALSGPQVVTESGVLMGFGAFDDVARLDVTA
ncbi:MAG: hypothetical protein EPN26_13885 [Rhodospirillales bacterium]|nr:MAG: hypothetical protein EPN26_13885 [Rhodospirillales bacterium]